MEKFFIYSLLVCGSQIFFRTIFPQVLPVFFLPLQDNEQILPSSYSKKTLYISLPKVLAENWGGGSQRFDVFFKNNKKKININSQSYLRRTIVLTKTKFEYSMIIHPILCRLWDHTWFFLEAASYPENELLAITYHAAINVHWKEGFLKIFSKISNKLKNKLKFSLSTEKGPLKLLIDYPFSSFPRSKNSQFCFNKLVKTKFIKYARIVEGIHGEYYERLRYYYRSTKNQQLRPNRHISLLYLSPSTRKRHKWPLDITLRVLMGESVYGSSTYQETQWILSPAKLNLENSFEFPASWDTWLNYQLKELDPKDYPMSVFRNGRWVYLDKGQAWGLKLGDRLKGTDSTKPIYAHVIGFYSKGLDLHSPRDYPISEGAIIYVRKGLKSFTKRVIWTFDTQIYPKKL